ncbi:MAG: NTP transferase domain-containing protein [bacterium]|nr:NTP transferase domain-containing protein [bacterium]
MSSTSTTTQSAPVPVVILGGADSRPAALPEEGRDKHPLRGYKAMDVQIGGRPLIDTVIDRLRASGGFDPIYVAGPRDVYGERRPHAEIIDTDGAFGDNIRAAIEHCRVRHPGQPIGFITCDVVPDVETLESVLEHFRRHRPCDLWFPMIQAPDDPELLGASQWKPEYVISSESGDRQTKVLPCHLAIADPESLRLAFVYKLFDLAYRTRNRPVMYRRGIIVRKLLFALLWQDLRHILGLRAPTLTWTLIRTGTDAARGLKSGRITRKRLEDATRTLFVKNAHRRKHPGRRMVLPIVEGLSLALDIDTVEEARAAGGRVRRAE